MIRLLVAKNEVCGFLVSLTQLNYFQFFICFVSNVLFEKASISINTCFLKIESKPYILSVGFSGQCAHSDEDAANVLTFLLGKRSLQ